MTAPPRLAVRKVNRLLDLAAIALLVLGAGLFARGREVLIALGNRTYDVPAGTTWLSVAERYDGQTRLGLWIAAAGLATGILSAVKHFLARREKGTLPFSALTNEKG